MKLKCIVLLFFIGSFSFGQNQLKNNPLVIIKKDIFYAPSECILFKIDSTRSLTFDAIKNEQFTDMSKFSSNNIQSIYWFKFSVAPKIKSNSLTLLLGLTDISEVFIPYKNKYKKFQVGLQSENRPIKIDISESSRLDIPLDSIDFSKPFYYNQQIISHWSKINLAYDPLLILTDNKETVDTFFYEESYTANFTIYSSIIFMAFLLFLISFFVTKDRNFLNYSIYLLFTALIFLPKIPVFYNFLKNANPKLYFYLTQASLILTSGLYLYFVCYFLEFQNRYPKIFILTKYTFYGTIAFCFIYISLLVFAPFFAYRFLIIDSFKIVFTIIALGIFIYLMLRKPDFIAKIVLIGSLLLIVGNVLSILLDSSMFFLNMVLLEILLFSGVVSLKNKRNTLTKIQSQIALETERKEKKTLLELDLLKTKFFTNISHEFRTPLTLIANPIEETLEDPFISDKKREKFVMAKRNSDRLLSLVNQLLDLSKIDAGHLKLQLQEGNVMQLISALNDSFAYQTKQKQIEYTVNIMPSDKAVYYDKDAVEKIVINLLSNALKYTPEHGKIICDTYLEANHIIFSVKNTGKGISKEELTHIFKRFYQTSEENYGTGIGLALVKELVELHKGSISVDSDVNHFTTFRVTLPVDKQSYKNERFVGASLEKTKIQTNTYSEYKLVNQESNDFEDTELPILLIVEDNADLRHLLKQSFEENYNILTANNGEKGIELALEHIPDIIISDIMMPIKDGIALTKTLKNDERTSHIPIILLTAKAGDSNELRGIEVGADDYLTKPFNSKILTAKVSKLIEIRQKLQSRYSQEVILTPKDIAVTSLDEKFLEKVQSVLEEKLIESSFSTEDFSKAVGMSRMQLHRKIKALTGLSASEFIKSQRLKLASQLLKTSDINIAQVGYSVGFNDHSYFAKCFKDAYNCTPTEFAKRK